MWSCRTHLRGRRDTSPHSVAGEPQFAPATAGVAAPTPVRADLTSASMVTIRSTVTYVSVIAVTAAALSACTPRPDGPTPAAEQFFARLATGDTTGASQLTDRPDDARTALNASWAGLQASHLDAQVLGSGFTEDTGTVDYRYTWHLPKDRTWTYDGQLNMVRNEGNWEVRWAATGLHPKLGEHQSLELRGGAAQARLGQRAGRHRRAAAGQPVPLRSRRESGRRRPDADGACGGRGPAPVRRHPGPAAPGRAGQRLGHADGPDHAAQGRQRPGGAGDRAPARRGRHTAGRSAAHRRHLRPGHRQRGEEVRHQAARRRGRLGDRQRQPERRRRRRAQRGRAGAGAVGVDHAGPGRAGRRTACRRRPGPQGDARRHQAVDGRDPGRRAERGRRRRRPDGDHGPVPARVDVQDRHRRGGHRPQHGHPQHLARLPGRGRDRPPNCAELQQVRPRHRPDGQGVRELLQHHLRRTGQPDAAAGTDAGGRPVRHRPRLHDRRAAHGDGVGAADGGPRRTHRGRLRSGQGADEPVRDGAGRGHRRGGQDPGAASDRGPAHADRRGSRRRSARPCSTGCAR